MNRFAELPGWQHGWFGLGRISQTLFFDLKSQLRQLVRQFELIFKPN